jgi:NuA3 HAT complex component NTO1
LQISSAAAVAAAAAAVQNEGYKPREERGWEEFHPNLDIEATIMVYNAEDVDGVSQPVQTAQKAETSVNGAGTPINEGENIPTAAPSLTDTPSKPQGKPNFDAGAVSTPPPRRRPGRPPRDHSSFYGIQANGMTPKTPKVLPIHNQNPKERLDLKQASYRRTDRIALFESKTFGQARYVDKSMMNVGYQESDNYIRPVHDLIKASDANVDEELEPSFALKPEGDTAASTVQNPAGAVGRVEYDMDEQDDMWLEKLNAQRKTADLGPITREMFEITITKIEKCWHALEKRIPKPNPKPPQTHRPRSSSAAAVNGEPQAGEEQDSKCAICDDGDCENTNAIVFCDGCDLAVHQECYGVPFIPEGQWLCRKCQLIGRGIPVSLDSIASELVL